MVTLPVFLQAPWLCILLLVCAVFGHPAITNGRDTATPNSFSLNAVRNPAFTRNGPHAYAKALHKFGAELPDDFPDVQIKGSVGSVPAWNQSYDREYLSPIWVGTPPQMLLLDLDTGSSDLWVFSTETEDPEALGNRHIYRPNSSETALRAVNHTWYITYGDNSMATGYVFTDDVQLGEITIKNATIESALRASPLITSDPALSGLMGLAFNHSSTVLPEMPNLLGQLWQQHGVDLFAVDLKYHDDDGVYTFGQIDEAAHTGPISWQPLLPGSMFWHIHLTAFQVGGTNTRLIYRWPVILDTGTTLVLLQDDLVNLYWERVPGAWYDAGAPGWVFPCNVTGALPDLIFGFHDDGWTGAVPGKYMNYQELDGGVCYGGIQGNHGLEFAILGDVLLKAVYVVFDAGGERVGFAHKELF